MTLEPVTGAAKLMVVHELEQDGAGKFIEAVKAGGWLKILSYLKSLLEAGAVALTLAYEEERGRIDDRYRGLQTQDGLRHLHCRHEGPPPEFMDAVKRAVAEKPWLK